MSHHRLHAADFIVKASQSAAGGLFQLGEYLKTGDTEGDIGVLIAAAVASIGKCQVFLVEAAVRIHAGDLDEVRSFLNQPKRKEGVISDATSALSRISIATSLLARASRAKAEPSYELGHTIQYLSSGWDHIDRAIWHVNDAIREEVYNDPDFAEAP